MIEHLMTALNLQKPPVNDMCGQSMQMILTLKMALILSQCKKFEAVVQVCAVVLKKMTDRVKVWQPQWQALWSGMTYPTIWKTVT
jgi:hypothetical protein